MINNNLKSPLTCAPVNPSMNREGYGTRPHTPSSNEALSIAVLFNKELAEANSPNQGCISNRTMSSCTCIGSSILGGCASYGAYLDPLHCFMKSASITATGKAAIIGAACCGTTAAALCIFQQCCCNTK